MKVPNDLLYTKTHEWVRLDGEMATVGITDFAQSELGDIVFVELANPGRSLTAEQSFGTVESVKTVSDVYAPLPGEITEANPALGAQPELVNSDPYGNGWLVKMKIDPSAASSLLSAEAYTSILES